jgi:hypothetical protein
MNVHRAFHGEHARVWEGSERCAGPIQNDTSYMDVERSGPPMVRVSTFQIFDIVDPT